MSSNPFIPQRGTIANSSPGGHLLRACSTAVAIKFTNPVPRRSSGSDPDDRYAGPARLLRHHRRNEPPDGNAGPMYIGAGAFSVEPRSVYLTLPATPRAAMVFTQEGRIKLEEDDRLLEDDGQLLLSCPRDLLIHDTLGLQFQRRKYQDELLQMYRSESPWWRVRSLVPREPLGPRWRSICK
ncbi:hypothetical protein HPP92_028828 [Vanilla planifolia]|uniref:Uncharacterized protein n=1 Tax=Vanilla planifolia TaxID=51239 RepID=A0A835P4N1_VANPL|nr:hypothetical protein HPP92_028828 [Vanilla planifolia]KAG0446464.1 hypothetical protein HPP92_028817 [Vanilla planifolia]